jgi:hypothetical protein
VHRPSGRRLREVARRTRSVDDLGAWIDELMADYRTRINRAVRFRNGIIHGGVAQIEVARTVRYLINSQARLAAKDRP